MVNGTYTSVADPGFPVGGGANLQCVHFLAKTHAKMKEMDPVGGGGRRQRPLDMHMCLLFLRIFLSQVHDSETIEQIEQQILFHV